MPTGYTNKIKDGITFQQFAMNCARAFDACIMMRDDPADKPIPEKFKVSEYHSKELKKVQEELEKINNMTTKGCAWRAEVEFSGMVKERAKHVRENRELINQYKDMLQEVKQWQPPTSNHTEFKEFMISQIEKSIEFDSSEDYYIENPIKKLTGEEWLAKKKKDALRDIDYYTKELKAEIERTDQRNKWITDLRNSLMGGKK